VKNNADVSPETSYKTLYSVQHNYIMNDVVVAICFQKRVGTRIVTQQRKPDLDQFVCMSRSCMHLRDSFTVESSRDGLETGTSVQE
jgi:hypothetical protein